MPKEKYKDRGEILRYRTIPLDGKYLKCAVMEKPGPRGGKTICTLHTKK